MSETKTMATVKGTPLPWTNENTKLVRSEETGQFVCDLSDDKTLADWLAWEKENVS